MSSAVRIECSSSETIPHQWAGTKGERTAAPAAHSGAYRDGIHRAASQFAVFNYHSQVACDHAKTYLDATECGMKEPGATIPFRIARLYGKSIEWVTPSFKEPAVEQK